MPIVDVIVPFYNTPIHFVREALVSVIGQTVRDWRAIVVNDGSNEQSTREVEVLLESLQDERITYLHTSNQGLAAARNNAIGASTSPYIALLDSDDVYYPERLAVGISELENNPDVDVSHASIDLILPDGRLKKLPPRDLSNIPPDPSGQFTRLLESNYVAVVTTTFRRSSAEAIGLFDPAFDSLEDKEFWLRMLMRGKKLRYLPQVVAQYRTHATNMSKNVEKMARGRRRLIAKLDGELANNPLITAAEWRRRKTQMLRHVQHEIAETYLEQNAALEAWNSLRLREAGWSLHTWELKARALYRLLRR